MISFFGCDRIRRRFCSRPIVSAARTNWLVAIWYRFSNPSTAIGACDCAGGAAATVVCGTRSLRERDRPDDRRRTEQPSGLAPPVHETGHPADRRRGVLLPRLGGPGL